MRGIVKSRVLSLNISQNNNDDSVAKRLQHLPLKQGIEGSNPSGVTKFTNMSEELTEKKAFIVFHTDTKAVIYAGNSLIKTISAVYSAKPTSISFANPINMVLLRHAVAMQERLN